MEANPTGGFLIACDGIYDCLTNKDVCETLRRDKEDRNMFTREQPPTATMGDPRKAVGHIIRKAYEAQSMDNMT